MAIKIVVPSVQLETVANQVFQIGDTLVIGEDHGLILDSYADPNDPTFHVIVSDMETVPAPGQPLRVAKNYGVIPLATENYPGLSRGRGRTYFETANTAYTEEGESTARIMDWQDVEAENVFHVGDWIKVDEVEHLIQTIAPIAGGIEVTVSPPPPVTRDEGRVYLQALHQNIPMATEHTPGVMPNLRIQHELRTYGIYVPGGFAPVLSATVLRTYARDFAIWGIEDANIERLHVRCNQQDTGAVHAQARLVINDPIAGTVSHSPDFECSSDNWVMLDMTANPIHINVRTTFEIEVTGTGTNGDSSGLRVLIVARLEPDYSATTV